MCTAISFHTGCAYFGRNLDVEFSFGEKVTITPRNYIFNFKNGEKLEKHYAMIGMAYVKDGYPLYYDATNEHGLSIAGLRFAGNAVYNNSKPGMKNIASFEFIPKLLGQCKNICEARKLIRKINITNENYSAELPCSPLHWLIADKESSITAEPLKDGIKIYDNPIGVLTNNPTFDYHMININNYMSLSNAGPENILLKDFAPNIYSRGMGALGLPGDLSSASRFVRAAFTKLNSVCGKSEPESVSQFFHILESVAQQRGCTKLPDGKYEFTAYSSCCNADRGTYYYKTYENFQICAVNMHKEDLDGKKIAAYPLVDTLHIYSQN